MIELAFQTPHPHRSRAGWRRILWLLLYAAVTLPMTGAEPTYKEETRQHYLKARAAYLEDPGAEGPAVRFGEACFDWAEFAENDSQRAALAEEGIAAMRELLLSHRDSAGGHYYLGLNLGQLARTKTLGALPIVREMERTFKASIAADPKFNYAGAHRSLGLLYLEAPGWPTSIGSNSKARQHLKKAVELAPEYPENQLCLMEAYARWKDDGHLAQAAAAYRKRLPAAKERFSGDEWGWDWADWDKRWRVIQSSLR